MAIRAHHIPLIENCLNFKLYDYQKKYLLNEPHNFPLGRCTGRTTAFCIKLALSDGEPLNISKPEEFSDMRHLSNHVSYARGFFRYEFMEIREKLNNAGFDVRDVKTNGRMRHNEKV